MPDDMDSAAEVAEIFRTAAISGRKPEPSIAATGRCLSCQHKVKPGRRWCNAECRDTWENEQ